MTVDSYSFYRVFNAIHLHFTTSYDIIKYNGKTKTDESKFYMRPDFKIFQYFAGKVKNSEEAGDLCIANSMFGSKNWIREGYDVASQIYREYVGRKLARSDYIERDLNKLRNYMLSGKVYFYGDFLSKTKKGNKPPLLQLYLCGEILPDTLVALDAIDNPFIDNWCEQYYNDPLVNEELTKVKKYKPFVKSKFTKIKPKFESLILSTHPF